MSSKRTWSSVYWSSKCHYCEGKAESVDHIVPRSLLPKPQSLLPYWFRSVNLVPACLECNGKKAALRSDCECEMCTWAWKVAAACFLTGPVPETVQICERVEVA